MLDPEKLLNPPRLATQTAMSELQAAVSPVPVSAESEQQPIAAKTPAPSEVIRADADANQTLTVWINETSEAHRTVMRSMSERFAAAHALQVEFIFVNPRDLLPLLRAANVADRMPDVVLHNSEQLPTLLAEGLLDLDASTAVVDALGRESFAAGAFDRLSDSEGRVAAIPSDGWQYLLLYRQDWFTEAGLPVPNTFERILNSAETFDTISFDIVEPDANEDPEVTPTPRPIRSGIVLPTEQDAPGTQRVFEWLANANGCQLIDEEGIMAFDSEACLDTLEFYRVLVNQFGPPDYQTDVTALKAFVDGRTAMVMLPPDALAYFANNGGVSFTQNVGIVAEINGYNAPGATSFSNTTMLGLTSGASDESATFVEFWFEQAYGDWLSVSPARKYPLFHSGSGVDWVATWQSLPFADGASLDERYATQDGVDTSVLLGNDLLQSERWGNTAPSDVIASQLYEELTIAPILTRMLNGYIGSQQASLDASEAILELIVEQNGVEIDS